MSDDSWFLTPRQLRERWQVTDNTLRKWRMNGKGPVFIRLGEGPCAPIRYPIAEVERYEELKLSTKSGSA
jgi:hypothetical protein